MLSPTIQEIKPPWFGTNLAISRIALVAVTELCIASTLSPVTEVEYFLIAGPNLTKSWAKSDKVLSPVNNATKPPLLGTILANSHKVLAALAEAVTASALNPVIILA